MFHWLQGMKPPPLSGAPSVRRQKHYTADSGYVFDYYYLGNRPSGGGTEYVFEVHADKRGSRLVSVVLGEEALGRWRSSHARELAATERYAVAKMSLLRGFDRCASPSDLPSGLVVSPTELDEIVGTLGID